MDLILEDGECAFEDDHIGHVSAQLAVERCGGGPISEVTDGEDDTPLLLENGGELFLRDVDSVGELSLPVGELPLLLWAIWGEVCEVGKITIVRALRMQESVVHDG